MSNKLLSLVILALLLGSSSAATGYAQARRSVPPKTQEKPAPEPPLQPQIKLTQPSKVETVTPVGPVSAAPAGPFLVGEKLSFNVSWSSFVTAAKLEMEVVGQGAYFGQAGYQLKTTVETVGSVRSLFTEVDNQYITYLDAATLLPYRTDNMIRQGRKNDDSSACFDRQLNLVRFSDNQELAVPVDTIDLPSLIYTLRQQDLTPDGKPKKFTTVLGRQLVEVEVQPKHKERVSTQIGSYDAIRVDLTARSPEKGEYKVRIWFTDDRQKLPLLMVSRPSFGEVRAELTQVTRRSAGVNLATIRTGANEIATTNPAGVVMEAASAAPSEFERRLPFGVGERLSYDIAWLNLGSIGKLNLMVQQRGSLDNKIVFELVGDLSTVGPARSIINLNDTFKSYALVDSLVPIRTDTSIQEGKRRKRIIAAYRDNSVRLDNGTHFNVAPKTLDLVSLFYSVRASQLVVGAAVTYNFVDANHRPQAVEIKTVKQESINSALGTRSTWQLDIINKDTRALMAQAWVTNDARRLPVYVVARLQFGEIRFEIKSESNPR